MALNQAVFAELLAIGITPVLPVFQASARVGALILKPVTSKTHCTPLNPDREMSL